MLKSTFVAIVLALLMLVSGGLVVPIMTGTEVQLGDFLGVLPVAVLVYLVSSLVIGSVFPSENSKKSVAERLFTGKLGQRVFVIFWLAVLLFSVLTLLIK